MMVEPRGALTLAATVKEAVISLYSDRVTPRASVLQWRLESWINVRLSAAELCRSCQDNRDIVVDPPQSKRLAFVALLKVSPDDFEGFLDDPDAEPPASEASVEASFDLLRGGGWPSSAAAHHSAFVVAEWLHCRQPALCLGVCLGLVRRATFTNILGSSGGRLVPYQLSRENEKRMRAELHLPTGVSPGERYVSSWSKLLECLQVMMAKGKSMEVARLKLAFRTRYSAELSETVFGYTSLSDLLLDGRLGGKLVVEGVGSMSHLVALCPSQVGEESCEVEGTGFSVALDAEDPDTHELESSARKSGAPSTPKSAEVSQLADDASSCVEKTSSHSSALAPLCIPVTVVGGSHVICSEQQQGAASARPEPCVPRLALAGTDSSHDSVVPSSPPTVEVFHMADDTSCSGSTSSHLALSLATAVEDCYGLHQQWPGGELAGQPATASSAGVVAAQCNTARQELDPFPGDTTSLWGHPLLPSWSYTVRRTFVEVREPSRDGTSSQRSLSAPV